MANFDFIDKELDRLTNEGLKRELKTVLTPAGSWVELSTGKRILQFASNNYLGLANHPEIINAGKQAFSKYGAGSSGSRLLSGTTELHMQLEKNLADFHNSESSIFFSSGYLTNIGVISALANKEDAIYSDELNHASIIDGIRFSGASKFIYNHNDMKHLEVLIQENKDNYKRTFIITDSVFSMDSDIAPLGEIGLLADKYNCLTLVDEAHAIGIFGKNGAGLVEELNLQDYFPLRTGTCSKALSVEGGFCTGSKKLIEYLQNKARSFIFSTSSSPATVGAILKSLELLKEGSWRKEKLWQNAKLLHSGLKKNYKLKINELKIPIITIIFSSIEETLSISEKLFNECHIWAPAIRPPSVKEPRIRLTPIATHTEDDIKFVIKAFDFVSKDIKVKPLSLTI